MRNQERTYSGCPILTDGEITAYLADGMRPAREVEYLEVPPGKVVRKRGFWLSHTHRMHHAANLFLISTDVYSMNADDLTELQDQIYCYRSPKTNTVYLGRVENVAERRVFTSLLDGLHEPFDIDALGLAYVGRVISAI